MPPKVKITKTDIINTALEIIRANGAQAVNARSIAAALNCSTQPIFSNFASMEALDQEVLCAAHELYLGFLRRDLESGLHPEYKALGVGYIRFAQEEKELFKLLFMRDREGTVLDTTSDFEASVEIIMKSNGVTRQTAEIMHFEMWIFVHGIATMLATSYLTLEWELISTMVSDVYQGIRARHLLEEK